ncbi:MAG: DUF5671 domain-containing protein [Anaerolineales bacterium]
MSTPRRVYIYAVAAISLYAVSWSLIDLLQGLFFTRGETDPAAIAFQIAVIVIGLPVFLGHWLWAQRLARREREEQESVARQVFLYGMQAAYLAPFIYSTQQIVRRVLSLVAGESSNRFTPSLAVGEFILYHLLSMVVVAALWFYLEQVRRADHSEDMEHGGPATVRRLYVFGFSAAGLYMTALAVQDLLYWLMLQIGSEPTSSSGAVGSTARLIVGFTVWLSFWRWGQRLFAGLQEEERRSVLRKFYLFSAVFFSVMSAVTSATFILAGFFKRILGVSGVSDGDIRLPISIIVVSAAVWFYHSYVIKNDIRISGEDPGVAGVRRVYLYLVAGIGLSAVLTGLSGDVSVLIRSLEQGAFGSGLSEELAWFTAILIAGLPVWAIPWREAQGGAAEPGEEGDRKRQSVVRRIYLYFFLFVSAMTVLGSAVFLAFQILATILGEPAPSLSELGQPIAFSLIAAGLWAYHWTVLRADGKYRREAKAERLQAFKALVVDTEKNELPTSLIDRLDQDFPELAFEALVVSQTGLSERTSADIDAQLSGAQLIIAPWTMTISSFETGMDIMRTVGASSAQKLLLPIRSKGWEWAGVNPWTNNELVAQTVRAVRQIIEGEEVKPGRQLGGCAIAGIVIAFLIFVLVVLGSIGPLLGFMLGF